jgi:outer membrane receptor for ferrienterochelin and colicin
MKIIFTALFTFSILFVFAQRGENPGNTNVVYTGKVVDGKTGEAIDFANVSIYEVASKTLLSGTDTDNGGLFEIQSAERSVFLQISYVGYTTSTVTEYQVEGNTASFGIIEIMEEGELLEEVVVRAERSTTEFKTDRRVFNVGTDLTSSGAGALEVLNNVPSVNVDIEGAVTLRGSSGVQILINGKPSVLADDESGALGNITADMIDKIEVITNPSAKYEAEGTSGIINIILKKNKKKALNGSVSVNVGEPANHSVGVSLNKRTERFNLFTQLGVGKKDRISDNINRNRNLRSGIDLNSVGTQARNEGYFNAILGSDFYLDSLNTITLTGSFTFESEDQPSFTTFEQFENGLLRNSWDRSETTTADNPKIQYELQYKKEFRDNEEHILLFSAIGNYFGKKQSSTFTERLISGDYDVTDQLTATDFNEGKYTFNLDYTRPLANDLTIETGLQYVDNKVGNDYKVENFTNGEFVVDNGLTNFFDYSQNVLGAYTTVAREGKVWGIKVGVRAEYTDLTTSLEGANPNNQEFIDLFPSAHTSYKVNERISLQAGYSRRIYRPRLWDLNPFFNIRNNFAIRAGNPDLLPEYTDSYEVGSVFIFDAITFNVNAYRRYTTDKIERISTVEETVEGNITTTSPLNIGTAATNGIELNFKITPVKKLTINGDMNYNYFVREGEFEGENFDFSNDQYNLKLNTRYKFSRALEMEITGRYQSRVQTVQGRRSENYYMDFGARYKILNGKIVFNLSVRDVFASRIRESFVFNDNFENYSFSQYGRFITFGVSYGFGKGEAMQYGGARRRG